MYFDIKDLVEFYSDTSLGKRTASSLSKTLNHLFKCGKGEMILGYGFTTPLLEPCLERFEKAVSLMPGLQGAINWPTSGKNVSILVDEAFWPVETESVDTVLILHGLENSLNPNVLLSEAWRVLKPNGTLLVFVSNRAGFWARTDITPFGCGRPYSFNQLSNLLKQTNFAIEKNLLTLNGFPTENNMRLSLPNVMTYLLNLTKVELFSGVIAVKASKKIFAPEKLVTDYLSLGVRKLSSSRGVA